MEDRRIRVLFDVTVDLTTINGSDSCENEGLETFTSLLG